MRMKSGFGLEQDSNYERGKQQIENFIRNGQFTQVVQNRETYDTLIKSMRQNNKVMSVAIQEGQKRIRKIMAVTSDERVLGQKISQMVDQCLEIDIDGTVSEMKRQRSEALAAPQI